MYEDAVEDAFGADIDCAMLVKIYGPSSENPESRYRPCNLHWLPHGRSRWRSRPKVHQHVIRGEVESFMRMGMRRFTRLTNGFSKKLENYWARGCAVCQPIQCNGIDYWFDPKYRTIMNAHLTIDKAGRVVIPKSLREDLHLEPGDALEMESTGEQITLRPVRGTGPLRKEHGVWVFYTGQPLLASATDEVIEQIRTERDLANLGEEK